MDAIHSDNIDRTISGSPTAAATDLTIIAFDWDGNDSESDPPTRRSSCSEICMPIFSFEIYLLTVLIDALVNAPDAEIRFQSYDGVIFHIHKINLYACTEGFSPPENCTFHELVPLSEESYILELLFQFIYPQPQPDLSTLAFEDLLMLSEAAEKYVVYPAMNLCTVYLIKHLPENDDDILAHGLQHKILALVNAAAPVLLRRPLEDVVAKIGSDYSSSFRKYHMQWTEASRKSLSHLSDLYAQHSGACYQCIINVTSALNSRVATPQNIDSIFKPLQHSGSHYHCFSNPLFKGWHPDCIRVCAGGLLQAELEKPIIVPLHSTTFALLVQFIQRFRHPDLATADVFTLLQIYEAASKYKVFTAIDLCKIRLNDAFAQEETLKSHTAIAMNYALLVNDYELVDKVAPLLVSKLSLADAEKFMGSSRGIKWVYQLYFP
ncbi:hypothetical protein H0H92_012753 [Tricholoma furcatifolium]|nr:hypothetical protein H0H92_012753 [Tricholoma furcatifolium]